MSTERAWPRADSSCRWASLAALLTSTVATFVILRGTWGSGQYLFRDFVAVPNPARPEGLFPKSAAALRGWPLDAVSWLLSFAVPPGAQQAILLSACILLAGTGAGILVARMGVAASMTAAALAVWNPYVVERLLLGQPPTLLAYACLPWVVLVVRSRRRLVVRVLLLLVVAAPAALTPWGGAMIAVAAVVGTATRPSARWADVVVVSVAGLVWCLPWLVPTLLVGGVTGDPDGARAFALTDDTGRGTLVSALFGGGVWARGAQPASRVDPVAILASSVILAAASLVVVILWRRRSARVGAASAVLLLGPATFAAVASGPALGLVADLQSVPGFALVRDQHRMLGVGVLTTSVLVGVGVGWVARTPGALIGAAGGFLALSLAVTSVPDLPRAAQAAYQPAHYPRGWSQVVTAVAKSPGSRTVLSLPWQPLRQPGWAPERPFLDPSPRAVRGEVLTSTALTVRRDQEILVVDDTPEPAGGLWSRGEVSGASLRSAGVTHVLEWVGTPGVLPTERPGWRLLVDAPDFRLWDVTAAL